MKVLVYELDTGRLLVKRIGLEDAPDRNGSFLNDIAVDETRKVGYISDSGRSATKAGVIAIDFASGSARRMLSRHPSVCAQPGVKVMSHGAKVRPGSPMVLGINGVAPAASHSDSPQVRLAAMA